MPTWVEYWAPFLLAGTILVVSFLGYLFWTFVFAPLHWETPMSTGHDTDAILEADLKIESLHRQLEQLVGDNAYLRRHLDQAHYEVGRLKLLLRSIWEAVRILEADIDAK